VVLGGDAVVEAGCGGLKWAGQFFEFVVLRTGQEPAESGYAAKDGRRDRRRVSAIGGLGSWAGVETFLEEVLTGSPALFKTGQEEEDVTAFGTAGKAGMA
jgi:hypothetical protein